MALLAWTVATAAGVSAAEAAVPATTISFDTDAAGAPLAAPCAFVETAPLTELYAPLGVHFSGSANLVGAAILDQCGEFGVPARSGENFLAFNRGTYAEQPETIRFDELQRRVTIFGGDGEPTTFTMVAYRGDTVVDTSTATTVGASYVELTVESSQGIDRVVLSATDFAFVFDDLSFTPLGSSTPAAQGDCKKGGWRNLANGQGRPFRNQGQCVSYVVAHRR